MPDGQIMWRNNCDVAGLNCTPCQRDEMEMKKTLEILYTYISMENVLSKSYRINYSPSIVLFNLISNLFDCFSHPLPLKSLTMGSVDARENY